MARTLVFYKETQSDRTVSVGLNQFMAAGETLTSAVVQSVSPATTPALTVTAQSAPSNPDAVYTFQGGLHGTSYGAEVLVTTSVKTFIVLLAINVQDASAEIYPYTTQNPDAFRDLIGEIQAGEAAIGTGVFAFGPEVDPTGGYVTWELLAENGTVYSAGNAFSYSVQSTGFSNTVFAKAVVNVPSDIPPTLEGQKYQIRWVLTVDAGSSLPQTYYTAEQITVVGLNTVPLGTQPIVELQGMVAQATLVTNELFDTVTFQIYYDNTPFSDPIPITGPNVAGSFAPVKVANGWMYAASIDTSTMYPDSVRPFTMIWRYSQSQFPSMVFSEQADFWVINATISQAVADVKSMVNKARTTLYGTPDLLFPAATILTWLRRGMDMFNGFKGYFTNFSMLNAKGSIREYWLLCTELMALRSQYLAEGEKAFDFQGQAISLNVDRTAYLDAAANQIQQRLADELPNFKTQLINKGNTSGDGSVDPNQLQRGAMGTVGITISPATWSGRYPYYPGSSIL